MEIGLVSCTKSKRDEAAQPKDLYLESAFFRKARQYAEANHDAWYILSAKHHLLDPDGDPIEPYDETLSGASVETKREWAETVFEQLREEDPLADGTRLVFHAGQITTKNSHRCFPRRVLNSLSFRWECPDGGHDECVDAVLHAGDVFDHGITPEDRNHVREEIQRTHDAEVPVYYIYGNHDNEAGNRTLRRGPGVHPSGETVNLGADAVRISALDYGAGGFSSPLPVDVIDERASLSILLLHDTPYPAVDENGAPIYRNDPNHLDLREFLNSTEEWLYLIVPGHLHVGSRGSIAGYETPLVVTDPTVEISTATQENNPSTWLVTVSEGEIQVEREVLA